MFGWFSSSESVRFGKELATFVLGELSGSAGKADAKFHGQGGKGDGAGRSAGVA